MNLFLNVISPCLHSKQRILQSITENKVALKSVQGALPPPCFFPLNHLKFPSAGQKLYVVPLPKHADSLSCGCFRYCSAQVSVLSSSWISSGCNQSSRSGLYQGLCCPSSHSSISVSAARKGHLRQLKVKQMLVPFETGVKRTVSHAPPP